MSILKHIGTGDIDHRIRELINDIHHCEDSRDCVTCPFNTEHKDCIASMILALHSPEYVSNYYSAELAIERFKNTPLETLDEWLDVLADHVKCLDTECCFTCPMWFDICLCKALREEHKRLNDERSC